MVVNAKLYPPFYTICQI